MKRLLFLLLILNTGNFSLKGQEKKGIDFQEIPGWAATLVKAKAEHKMIFVDVYTTWCGPCKAMEEYVYTDENLGILVNKNFISIKVQMDSTGKDNLFVRSWYNDSKNLAKTAKIEGFPSFLFFSSEGKLVYKTIGYRDVNAFSKIVTFASDPARNDFRNLLLAYQSGKKDFSQMADLAITVKELLGDKILAFSIAKDYKVGYLDNLSDKQFFNRNNLQFINENGGPNLLRLNDRIFRTAYYKPALIDSLLRKGTAEEYVKAVITKDLVTPKLFRNGKPISTTPNWNIISSIISKKYPKIGIRDYLLDQKINYYKARENWNLYTLYKSEQLKKNPPKVQGIDVFLALNMPAWDAFQNCNDTIALKRALGWSNQSLALETDNSSKVQYLDTKANLLYKLGRAKEAIAIEEQAIELSKKNGLDEKGKFAFQDEYLGNIEKMKAGIATWK